MPHNKKRLLNRISRIFNHKEDGDSTVSRTSQFSNLSDNKALAASLYNKNSSLPILLQRAPSSKLLIEDDIMDSMYSTIEHSSSFSNIFESTKQENRKSWFSTLSKLKTFKGSNKSKRKSNECCFITKQHHRGSMDKIVDLQQWSQLQEGVTIEEEVKKLEIASPLSVASSINSTRHFNNHHLSSSSSFWIQGDTYTARTSMDSQSPKISTVVEQPNHKRVNLAVNVKNILGDAILLADKELDI